MEKVKAAFAAVSAWITRVFGWIDANPRKAALATLGIGLVAGIIL